MKDYSVTFISGLIFAIGLGLSGMTLPERVIGFMDLFGQWNPSLAFVMIGAIGFHSLSYYFIKKRPSPIFAKQFYLPEKSDIDRKLILGAIFFGIGWALAGYCPGPAITSLVSGSLDLFIFVLAMVSGMFIFKFFVKK